MRPSLAGMDAPGMRPARQLDWSTMKRIRTAVIGGGHLGRIHTKLLLQNPKFELIAVCDPQPLIQQRMIQEFDIRVVSNYHKILDQVEAAVIATPTSLHAPVAQDCLEQGIHLLVEKPLTHELLAAEQILERAQEQQRVVLVGHVERYNPAICAALAAVGTPRFMSAVRASSYPFRSTDIGAVLDLMIHDIDLANAIFDAPLTDVRACGSSMLGGHEDVAFAHLTFANGGVAQLQASRCSLQPQRMLHIYGVHGFASVDLSQHGVQCVHIPDWLQRGDVNVNELPAEVQALAKDRFFEMVLPRHEMSVEPANAIAAEHAEWGAAIRQGKPLRVTLPQAVAAVKIASQISSSIAQQSATSMRSINPAHFALSAPSPPIRFPIPAEFQSPPHAA